MMENRVFVRDVLKILSLCLLKGEVLRGSLEYRFGIGFLGFVFRVFDRLRKKFYVNSIQNCFAQDRSLSIKSALPCGAS